MKVGNAIPYTRNGRKENVKKNKQANIKANHPEWRDSK